MLTADKVDAVFVMDQTEGKRKLDHADADGHVVITTPTDVLTGDHGTYTAGTSLAVITGHVKITRGPNVLEGERAEVDLATNVSRMIGAPDSAQTGTGRVRGVFYPGSGKTDSKGDNKAGGGKKEQGVIPLVKETPPAPVPVLSPTPQQAIIPPAIAPPIIAPAAGSASPVPSSSAPSAAPARQPLMTAP